jgi:serine/threonine protein kinase
MAEPMLQDSEFPADLRTLGRDYELIREIGQGGMAAIYLARRRSTGALVAIKAIRARYIDDQDTLQRFAREARTVADLDHPNIVRTVAIEQIGDRAVAIISEYIAGGTVRDRLRTHGAFTAEEAERVLCDVGKALDYAHRRGIVHRDVKPENVFLDERTGRALLADFGIARRIEGDAPITVLGSALGTPQYMSPEQIDGGAVDGRSDIYSLGVLGWELLTGRVPWVGESLYSIIYKQKHEELPPITSLRPRVPANLLVVIERALMKDRERRWQNIEELLAHLTYDPTEAVNVPTVQFRRPPPEPSQVPNADAVAPAAASVPAVPASERGQNPRHVTSPTPKRVERPRLLPRWTGRRGVLTGLALLIPLAIAGGSLYAVFGRLGEIEPDRDSTRVLTSSGGTVSLDTARLVDSSRRAQGNGNSTTRTPITADSTGRTWPVPSTTSSPTATSPTAVATPRGNPIDRPRAETTTSVASNPPRTAPPTKARATTAPARKSAARDSSAVGATAAPSPRCRVASMADQRACLIAYIMTNDAPLQRVYDSLIVELRRRAGVARRAPDPPSVTRLRVEQRAWIAVRDRECMRKSVPGSVSYWAEPLSGCFAGMSASRADELSAALRRLREGPR